MSVGAKAAYIEPGSSWESGCYERFNARVRDELLDCEISCSLCEAQILIEQWMRHYSTKRPKNAQGHRQSAHETIIPMDRRLVRH